MAVFLLLDRLSMRMLSGSGRSFLISGAIRYTWVARVEIEKIPTGIDGLDDVLDGGLPKNNLVLVSGPPGSGKSTLGAHFLVKGASEGQNGLYISVGGNRKKIVQNLRSFGWDIDQYLEEDKIRIKILEFPKQNYEFMIETIKTAVRDIGVERIFIDSLTLLKALYEDALTFRKRTMELRQTINSFNVTTLATAEKQYVEQKEEISVEEYIVDGVINMYALPTEDGFQRYLTVRKMVGTEHVVGKHAVDIGTGGITLSK